MKQQVKVTKISELNNAFIPNNIPEGAIHTGEMTQIPTVGERFTITESFAGQIVKYFSTSEVQKIIDNNTFKTHNSIYVWENI